MKSMGKPANTAQTCRILTDAYGRRIDYARISVTSRCNLRCVYCMREEHQRHHSPAGELTTEEIFRCIEALAVSGFRKVRFTGGEPLIRRDIVDLVRYAKAVDGIETVSLTTNGILLDRYFEGLIDAGLNGINLSLDTFEADRYRMITRRNLLHKVSENLDRLLRSAGSLKVKINVLLLREINSSEIGRFTELTRHYPVTVRFMELMPFDDNQIWRTGKFMGAEKILEALTAIYPELEAKEGKTTEHFSFSLPGYEGSVAIIPAYTRNFCSTCNRLRITSDGKIISCLYSGDGVDLLPALRGGAEREVLTSLLQKAVSKKPEDGREAGRGARGTSMSEIGG